MVLFSFGLFLKSKISLSVSFPNKSLSSRNFSIIRNPGTTAFSFLCIGFLSSTLSTKSIISLFPKSISQIFPLLSTPMYSSLICSLSFASLSVMLSFILSADELNAFSLLLISFIRCISSLILEPSKKLSLTDISA